MATKAKQKKGRYRPRLAYMSRWHAARRAYWIALGGCPGCGAPRSKYVYCVECRAMRAKAALKWWNKNRGRKAA